MFKNIAFFFTLLIVIVLIIFTYFKSQVKEQTLDNVLDQCVNSLNNELKNQKLNALELAIVLANNKGLVDALENDDEDLGYKILSDVVKKVKYTAKRDIRAQIITSELNIFARSWDDVYTGMPLGDYRTDLEYFKTHNTPRSSLEIGRRLGVKATVPIYVNDQLIGFLEVLDFFEDLTEYFKVRGISIYALLDYKYFYTSVFMQQNRTIKDYIIANRTHNWAHIKDIEKIDFKSFKINRIESMANKYFFYESMRNGAGEIIGAFVFVLPQKYLDYFKDSDDDISYIANFSKNDLYLIEQHEREQTILSDLSASEFLSAKNIIANEDYELFLDDAYKKLDIYSKEELIQLILNDRSSRKIEGKIK